jgi:hypothetical protein
MPSPRDQHYANQERQPKIRILDYPSRYVRYHTTIIANVGGCSALALDPHGRFLAIAGADSIVNVFETKDWFKANTLTSCECVRGCALCRLDTHFLTVIPLRVWIFLTTGNTLLLLPPENISRL